MKIFSKIHKKVKDYIQKDLTKDKFDGNYPFGLNNIPYTKYKSFGEKNPDKVFYVIYRTPYEAGFFSNFMHVVKYLKQANDLNLIPVVDFQNFKTFYNTDKPINGTENSWEYYFEQVSPYSLEEVYQSKHVLFCDGVFPHGVSMTSDEFSEYYCKAFKVKQDVLDIVAQYDKYFENHKVLGVHFRGKDINFFPGHPFGPTEKQMFKYTDEIIRKYKVDKIYVATDEKSYLDAYIKRYGDMVFYADNLRTEKINEFNINPRENHRYLLGREVLTDMMLLLRCQGLLHGHSNVITAINFLKKNYEFNYFIDNGRNVANKYQAKYLYKIRKRLPKNFGGLWEKVEIIENTEG